MQPYYEQCADCKRLAQINPYTNAASPSYRPEFTLVDGRKLCWECTEKAIKVHGMIPARTESEAGR